MQQWANKRANERKSEICDRTYVFLQKNYFSYPFSALFLTISSFPLFIISLLFIQCSFFNLREKSRKSSIYLFLY